MGSLNGKIFQFWLQLVLYWNCYYYWMNCYEKKKVLPVYNKILAFQRIVVLIPVFKRGRGYCSIFFFLQHCINAVISSINGLTSANLGFKQLWLSLADKHPTRVELSDSLKKALRTLKACYRALSAFSWFKRWVRLTVYW